MASFEITFTNHDRVQVDLPHANAKALSSDIERHRPLVGTLLIADDAGTCRAILICPSKVVCVVELE